MKGMLWAVIFVVLPATQADIQAIKYPQSLEKCLKSFGDGEATQIVGENLACFCISTFAFRNKQKIKPHVASEQVRQYVDKMSQNPTKRRRKRGTFLPPGNLRIRKEYRMLSERERENYHNCMNQLKRPNNNGFSRYDELASIHSGNINAHGGVNFLAWHRVYLWT
ncbi:tyrosinase-like protein 2 [Mizuhopecten yessoensis]|uniref:tyrosinase-like protein 2 n=1 Tax=Mizuhopecten yessoensis TaxID=6573 RepID=UPI000B45D30E|nr:tyrosinase-like protein 2 [Mizuhopecten yessoensis]